MIKIIFQTMSSRQAWRETHRRKKECSQTHVGLHFLLQIIFKGAQINLYCRYIR